MASELLLIKLLAVAVTVFDLVKLIDVIIRDDFAFMKFSISKMFEYDCTIGEHGWLLWTGGVALAGAEQSGLGLLYHPLNSGRRHPLSTLAVGM